MSPLDATKRELLEAGIAFRVEDTGKHYKVRFRVNGRGCTIVCSRTSSDRRAGLNARLLVRRKLRERLEK